MENLLCHYTIVNVFKYLSKIKFDFLLCCFQGSPNSKIVIKNHTGLLITIDPVRHQIFFERKTELLGKLNLTKAWYMIYVLLYTSSYHYTLGFRFLKYNKVVRRGIQTQDL